MREKEKDREAERERESERVPRGVRVYARTVRLVNGCRLTHSFIKQYVSRKGNSFRIYIPC